MFFCMCDWYKYFLGQYFEAQFLSLSLSLHSGLDPKLLKVQEGNLNMKKVREQIKEDTIQK